MDTNSSDADAGLLTIRNVGEELGLSLRTLRFYEAKGMIAPKREGRRRLYHTKDVERLRTIVKLKTVGLSLREIQEVLQSPPTGGPYGLTQKLCEEVFRRLSAQRAEAEAGLALLADAGCRCGAPEPSGLPGDEVAHELYAVPRHALGLRGAPGQADGA